ncbi:MAG TPA: acyl-CoA dehydrogenase family protein [Cyclobacteriaceae bacterium]|nr:acyl-CoA dehydrogenase family protein [Cyclobacteriaceae bacterium]
MNVEHPSLWLKKEIVDAIRSTAREAEALRHLHPVQRELVHREGWLKMLVPKNFGGLELTLLEVLQIEEALAWTDGSTAWVVTLCAGAAWFGGFLHQELAKEIFSIDLAFFAGSGASTGTAEIIPNGYLLNGSWKYASGSLHANVFTANFIIHENGKPKLQSNGVPLIRPFVMKKEEVTVLNTWNSMGMVATASHSFEIKNVAVGTERAFDINAAAVVIDKPIYYYPFLQLAETTLSVNLSGLAIRFIDLFEETVARPTQHLYQGLAQRARKKLDNRRKEFYRRVELSWKSCIQKKKTPKATLQKVSEASQALAKQSLLIVDQLYPHCGLSAADQNREINRVWRNIHTASQHSLFKWR